MSNLLEMVGCHLDELGMNFPGPRLVFLKTVTSPRMREQRIFAYFLSVSSNTQSPGERSYVQNFHPLQDTRLTAALPASEGEV